MKWYVTQTKDGESEPEGTLGGFPTEAEADAQKTLLEADFPADTISDPFEEADDYPETFPRVHMIYASSDGDVAVYTDGTQKLVS